MFVSVSSVCLCEAACGELYYHTTQGVQQQEVEGRKENTKKQKMRKIKRESERRR